MFQNARPAISVVMIAGSNRTNAKGVLNSLDRQSCSDDFLQVVAFDCAHEVVPACRMHRSSTGATSVVAKSISLLTANATPSIPSSANGIRPHSRPARLKP
jgi:hypothetical protein